jgi:hypothetical protein
MKIGDILLNQGLVTQADIDGALERQRQDGGRLGTNLVAMGVLTVDQLLTTLQNQQQIETTIDLCERTLANWESIYGQNHPNTNRARYNLARALLVAGRIADAATLAEASFAGHKAALGRDHAWTKESAEFAAVARAAAARADAAPAAAQG